MDEVLLAINTLDPFEWSSIAGVLAVLLLLAKVIKPKSKTTATSEISGVQTSELQKQEAKDHQSTIEAQLTKEKVVLSPSIVTEAAEEKEKKEPQDQVLQKEGTLFTQPAEENQSSEPPSVVKAEPVAATEIEPVKQKLKKTRSGLLSSLKGLFSSQPVISKESLEELRYTLVASDIGIRTADALIKDLTDSLQKQETITEQLLVDRLKERVRTDLAVDSQSVLETTAHNQFSSPRIVLVVGVNGVGKTTTTAKLASRLKEKGLSVMLVAADTFRAAAVAQLQTWGERLNVPVVFGAEDAKPQTVVFDAMKRAQQEKFDIILIDTAGRLNTKASLMQELSGVRNAVERHSADGIHEVLLVVDGTTGQNAVSQAKEFHAAATLTGIVVTKLDGTAKGGVVVAVKNEINVPVRYIGVGESAQDLRVFDTNEFVDALFATEDKELDAPSAHGEARRRRRREAA